MLPRIDSSLLNTMPLTEPRPSEAGSKTPGWDFVSIAELRKVIFFVGEKVFETVVLSDRGGRQWMQWTVECLFRYSDALIWQKKHKY